MATRALIRVFDGDTELCCIYKHYDGYPEGLGKTLTRFCKGMRITQGIGGDTKKTANGMPCFAAQLIAKLKGKVVGDVYLYAPGSVDLGEEYTYTIRHLDGDSVTVECN